jgi:hypothetical protein
MISPWAFMFAYMLLHIPTLGTISEEEPVQIQASFSNLIEKTPQDVLESGMLSSQVVISFKLLCLDDEILDPHETYLFRESRDAALLCHLISVRERYRNFANIPRLKDIDSVMPSYDEASIALEQNKAFKRYFESNMRYMSNEATKNFRLHSLNEINRIYYIWDNVRDMRYNYYIYIKRMAIGQLIEKIGIEATYQGKIPPPVPLHLLKDIDN